MTPPAEPRHGERFFVAVLLLFLVVVMLIPVRPRRMVYDEFVIGADAGGVYTEALFEPRHRGGARALVVYVSHVADNWAICAVWRDRLCGLRFYPLNVNEADPEYQRLRNAALDHLRGRFTIDGPTRRLLATSAHASPSSVLWFGCLKIILIPVALYYANRLWPPWSWFTGPPVERVYEDPAHCLSCSYCLDGLPTRVCPECGLQNPPDWRESRSTAE